MSTTQEEARKLAELLTLPVHSGDGYGWGGGAVLSFAGMAIQFGDGYAARQVAEHIVDAINAYKPLVMK